MIQELEEQKMRQEMTEIINNKNCKHAALFYFIDDDNQGLALMKINVPILSALIIMVKDMIENATQKPGNSNLLN